MTIISKVIIIGIVLFCILYFGPAFISEIFEVGKRTGYALTTWF